MKRLIGIFLLFIILLNIGGYYFIYEVMQRHNAQSFSIRLEEGSNGQEVIFKVPVIMPYLTQERGWESTTGQIEYLGQVYKVVRQKLSLDALYIACVKDTEGSRIQQEQADFVKTFSDQAANTEQNTKLSSVFVKEYISLNISLANSTNGWTLPIQLFAFENSLTATFSFSIIHPPERG